MTSSFRIGVNSNHRSKTAIHEWFNVLLAHIAVSFLFMSLAIHPLCHNQLRQSLWTILFAIFCPWLVSLSSRSSVFDVILRVEFWYCRSTEMFIMQTLSHCLPDSVGDRNCGALASANRTIRFKLIRVLSVEPNTARTLIYIMRLSRYLYWISCTTFHLGQ